MCGIAGYTSVNPGNSDVLLQQLNKMQMRMVHRGPDDGGSWVHEQGICGLTNRRLAIIDLSAAGHMPMHTADGQYTITYNGEVYNFPQVRALLESCGHTFTSSTDTEVILRAYVQWGVDSVKRLRGMFAFAIWDEANKRLFIARDHLGIKPLYYRSSGAEFLFASELNTLLSGLVSRPAFEMTAIAAYLRTGSVPAPMTIYENIFALQPGHRLIWENGQISIEEYWRIPQQQALSSASSVDAVSEVRALLAESVRLQMVTDVPLGAFLSGGLDSSTIVALMREASTSTIRTCSIVFAEAEYSEAAYVQQVAMAFETDHQEQVITGADVARHINHIVDAFDQPTIDGVNTYFVSKMAHETGLTVALSGLGGDELFGGYANTFRQVPSLYRLLKIFGTIPFMRSAIGFVNLSNSRWSKLNDMLQNEPSLASVYQARRGLFSIDETHTLLKSEALRSYDATRQIEASAGHDDRRDLFYWVSRAELGNYTSNQLLRDTDVMSMAHSLEVRVPFLDHILVEKIHRLPANLQSGKLSKPLLRSAMYGSLPQDILKRRDKQGFTFPFARWMKTDLSSYVNEMVSHERIDATGVLDPDGVEKIVNAFEIGKIHWSRLWAVVILSAFLSRSA